MSKKGQEILSNAVGKVHYRLTNDYLFRAVMQRNKKVLVGLLSALLYLKPEDIESIEITNPIILGEEIDEKTFILDIKIILNQNVIINIEMQVADYHDWVERSLVYLCRAFDQPVKGGAYLDIKETIHISILAFTLFPDYPEFYAKYQMLNVKNHHVYSDKFRLHVLDLTQTELATIEDRQHNLYQWAKLFKAQTWEEIKMLAKENEYIEEAAVTMFDVTAEENIRLQCEARQRYEEDRASLLASGMRQGVELGIEQGLKEGIKQGIKQGTERYAILNQLLIKERQYEEIERAAEDENYRNHLYEKYHID